MQEYGLLLTGFSRMKTESTIMSLYGRKRVSENLCFRVFNAVHIINNNIDPY